MNTYTFKTPDPAYLDNGTMQANKDWLLENVTEEDTFIDIGAHIGCVFIPVVGERKPKRALAFEPTPEVFKMLELNCKQVKNYELYNKAVSNKSGVEKFYEADWGSPSNTLVDRFEGKLEPYDMQVVALNDIRLDGPIVIKMDAELSEPKIWEGMSNHYSKIKAVCMEIFVEAYYKAGVDFNPMLKMIRDAGFGIYDHAGREISDEQIQHTPILDVIIR